MNRKNSVLTVDPTITLPERHLYDKTEPIWDFQKLVGVARTTLSVTESKISRELFLRRCGMAYRED